MMATASTAPSSALDRAQAALQAGPVADLGPLLKPGGRRELEAAIQRLGGRGLRVRVLVLPQGAALSAFHSLWQRLGLGPSDLLLLFNGRRVEARGWGLEPRQVSQALAAAEAQAAPYHARRLVNALETLAAAAPARAGERAPQPAPAPAPPPRPSTPAATPAPAARDDAGASSVLPWALGVGATAVAAGVGWVMVRRQRLARERAQSLDRARSDAEQVFADVVLAAEEMPEAEGAALRERASRLHGELGALPSTQQQKALPAREQKITLARFGQIENELEALRSVVLQRKRRQ